MPGRLQRTWEPERAFAWLNFKATEDDELSCGFHENGTLLIASLSGVLNQYRVPEEGGECKLIAEHSLQNTPDQRLGQTFYASDPSAPSSPGGTEPNAWSSGQRISSPDDAKRRM